MTTINPISPQLQAKIDALEDERLRANIMRRLSRPRAGRKSNEQIFEDILEEHRQIADERAKWHTWREDEVLAFIEHFKNELPEKYAEFSRQEKQDKEIDPELSLSLVRLAHSWAPELDFHDYTTLLGKVRGHFGESAD